MAADPAAPRPKPAETPPSPPPGSIPTLEPCDDNPDPIFQESSCIDPLQPWDPTEPGKPDREPADDRTLPGQSCPEHILDCGSAPSPQPERPGLPSRLPRAEPTPRAQ